MPRKQIFVWLLISSFSAFARGTTELPPSYAVKPELYATGIEWAEGPAFDRHGDLFVVNYRGNGKIGRIAPDGTASVYCDLRLALAPRDGRLAFPNGLKVDREERLLVADLGGGRLLRLSDGEAVPSADHGRVVRWRFKKDAADRPPVIEMLDSRLSAPHIEVLADAYEGVPFEAPNDIALDRAGNIYFTDCGAVGAVYRYGAKDGRLTRLDVGLSIPNGLAVTPDQRHLCVSLSGTRAVLIYDLEADGTLSHRRTLIDFTKPEAGFRSGGEMIPDGIIFDTDGRLYVAISEGGLVDVVDVPSGKLLRQYDAGGRCATNCHFSGGYLYTTITGKEAVFRLKLGVQGFDYWGTGG